MSPQKDNHGPGQITWIARGLHFPVTGNEEHEISAVVEPEATPREDGLDIAWVTVKVGQFRGVQALVFDRLGVFA